MNKSEIYEIWDKFENSDMTEFSFKDKDSELVLKKEIKTVVVPAAGVPAINSGADMSMNFTAAAGANIAANNIVNSNTADGDDIKAPLVGTFYRASSPDADPFVNEGDRVKKGDVVGVIEAMKLMNEIVAPRDGVITKILVENGKMAEYDQVLMKIK